MVDLRHGPTVAIPCFNPDPAHLREAIGSVKRSTLLPAEVVLIDDGSTHAGSLAALDAWAAAPRVRVVRHGRNRGLAAARNTGMAEARTPLVLQLDADDLIDPTFIEKAVWALDAHPEWAFVNAWVIGFGAKSYVWKVGFEQGRRFLIENQTVSIAMIRRDLDRAIGGHDETIRDGLEDWDYWLKMAAHGYWGGTLPEPLLFYRQHAQPAHWPNRNTAERRRLFRDGLRQRYPHLWRGEFPRSTFRPVKSAIHGRDPAVRDESEPVLQPAPPRQDKTILLVLPWLNLGGADRFNLNLTAELSRRGYKVVIATTLASDNPWYDSFCEHAVALYPLAGFLSPEQQPVFLRHLLESWAAGLCFISNSMLGYSLLGYLRKHCPSTVFVDYTHMVVTDWDDGGFARIAHEKQGHLDLNIVSSQQVKTWMVARGSDPDRIAVVYTGQDTAHFDPARFDRPALRQRLNLSPDTTVLLFPARLAPQKRPLFALKVLHKIRRRADRWVCLIAGDGPQRWLMRLLVLAYGLRHRVRLLGAVPPADMAELYAASDVLFLPSDDEGIALAVFEAMSMRLPVIAADVGGQRELVTPETGVLVPHHLGEEDAFADALVDLISNEDRRRLLGTNGRARIRAGFELAVSVDHLETAFARAKSLHQAAPRPVMVDAASESELERVVADLRADRLQERLAGPQRPEPSHQRRHPTLAPGVRWVKKRLLRPLYDIGLRNGLDFVVPLSDWLFTRFGWLR